MVPGMPLTFSGLPVEAFPVAQVIALFPVSLSESSRTEVTSRLKPGRKTDALSRSIAGIGVGIERAEVEKETAEEEGDEEQVEEAEGTPSKSKSDGGERPHVTSGCCLLSLGVVAVPVPRDFGGVLCFDA